MATTFNRSLEMHDSLIDSAYSILDQHIENQGGELCFNLFDYLADLEALLDGIMSGCAAPNGRFELDAVSIARYLWCCIAIEEGDEPDGDRFRGMPILD